MSPWSIVLYAGAGAFMLIVWIRTVRLSTAMPVAHQPTVRRTAHIIFALTLFVPGLQLVVFGDRWYVWVVLLFGVFVAARNYRTIAQMVDALDRVGPK
jgi:hypothetical protein